jgi:hypothetical protein
VLAKIHERLKPRTYLEIGVESGATLSLARFSELAIGIDPVPYAIRHPLPAGARLFREKSEDFFAIRTRESVLGERRVDLVFIDGMHRFENALLDFVNAEQWCKSNAAIVFHDCAPIFAPTAARERRTRFWVGDTWKTVLALKRHRPDLRVRTVLSAPSGLVVVRCLNPESNVLRQRFPSIVEELRDLEWAHAPGDFPQELSPVANDERGLAEALSER